MDARVRGRPARLLVICVTALAVAWAIGGTGLVDAIEQRVDYLAAKIEGHDAAAAQVVLVEITPQTLPTPSSSPVAARSTPAS